MKNLFRTLIILALVLASCSKEESNITEQQLVNEEPASNAASGINPSNRPYEITRSLISIPINDFPSIKAITNTIRENAGGFIFEIEGDFYYLRPGVTENEYVSSIYETPPSPAIILKLGEISGEPKWGLLRVDKNVNTWAIRCFKQVGNEVVLGDGNEIGPNEGEDFWKGDVWHGKLLPLGDIKWTRVTDDQSMGFHHGIALGDLNGDGLLDIGSGPGYGEFIPPSTVTIRPNLWINNGNGTYDWQLDLIPKEISNPFALEFADVTGDSRDEIILGGNSYGFNVPSKFFVYSYDDELNKYVLHSENSEENTLWQYGMFANKVGAYDFNNDGIKDIIDYMSDESGEGFGIWTGRGDGTYAPFFSKIFIDGSLSALDFEIFDANNDGYLDVLLRPNGYRPLFRIDPSKGEGQGSNGIKLNQMIWLNDGTGRFTYYSEKDLTIETDVPGRYFEPVFAIPYKLDDDLHFIAVEGSTHRVENGYLNYTVYDIKINL